MTLYKKVTICFLLLLAAKHMQGQYTITAIEPAGIFNFSDLWSFTITKSPQSPVDASYMIRMDIARQGEGTVISANSTKFSIPSTVMNINATNRNMLEPLVLNYSNGFNYSAIMNNNSRLPEGTYIVHLTLFEFDGPIKQLTAAEADYTFTIEPMAVLFQTSPMDGDSVCEKLPMFSWVYSYVPTTGLNITYTVLIVELADGQNPYDGLMYNPPYVKEENISASYFQYQTAARSLIPGKKYAWQILAINNNQTIAYSEVWAFTACFQNTKTEEKPLNTGAYTDVKSNPVGAVTIIDNTLRFRFYNKATTGELNFKILDTQNKMVANSANTKLLLKPGDNRYTLDLCGKDGFTLKKGNYRLVIIDAKKNEWYLLFENTPKYTCD